MRFCIAFAVVFAAIFSGGCKSSPEKLVGICVDYVLRLDDRQSFQITVLDR